TVFAELGYLYQLVDGQSQHDISEGFLHVRGRHGDVIAGRQHRFIGPANNNQVGTLLGLEAVDAVIYEAPLRRGFRQEVGYLFDTRALRNGGERGAYARGQAPVFAGNAGYSVLVPTRDGRNVGWSLDAAQPLIRNVLDVYAEGGKATGGRNLFSGGLYIPALYHRFKLDTFLEYANREDLEERVSLRLRREMGNGLLLVGFVDRELGTSRFTAGGGVVWTKKFR
ncbi:MAG TPA: hypothetical protein VK689_20595, partial [Armatimonadota bacterium]|nr:hypothetical protein [Armatimonadota bacterium]